MKPFLFATAIILLGAALAPAGARHFTYVYEAPTSARGSIESENYVTARWDEGKFIGFDFRNEIEFGITDRLQTSIYFANWDYNARREGRGFHYNSVSVETIYNLTNPVGDPIGISLYQEIGGGRRAFESETKLILQKNYGPLILAYNLTLEAEFGGESLSEHDGEIQNALGVSYEFTPRISVGVEALHEVLLPEWHAREAENNFFVGPNVSFRSNRWFATLTGLKQTTNTVDEADYQVRLIFGVTL